MTPELQSLAEGLLVALVILIVATFCALVGHSIGKPRGQGKAGAQWSFVLGPIGWIIAALLPEEGPRCPECRGVVILGARRCRHCGATLLPPSRHPLDDQAEASWYVVADGRPTEGPFLTSQLRSLNSLGKLPQNARLARSGSSALVHLAEVL